MTIGRETMVTGCPIAHDFDPLSPGYLRNPYPTLARLNRDAPIWYAPVLDRWVITRYAEIEEVLADPATYSAVEAQRTLYPVNEDAAAVLADLHLLPTLSNCDPPEHSRYRAVMARALSPRRMAKLEDAIQARSAELFDVIANEPQFDVMATVFYPLPALTVFTLIGFPLHDADLIKQWCADKIEVNWGRPSAEQQLGSAHSMVKFRRYCSDFVRCRRTESADDLVSDLIADERALTDDEITSLIFALSFAGHETTTNLLGNMTRQLLIRPEVWEEVVADRSLIAGATEETLRFDTSVPMWRRVTTRQTELAGVTLPAGARLVLAFGAASREPEHFPQPDDFDIRRANARRQLSFGKGIHFCLGAPLARLEARIVINMLAERMPDVVLVEDREPQYSPNISFRGPETLWVRRPGRPSPVHGKGSD
ncbi:MAG TPA: cytochrome P450 [Sporichthyaceae bacterium]